MTITPRQFLLSALVLCATTFRAQAPNNTGTYYERTNGKTGRALKTAFHDVIKGSPIGSYKKLWEIYKTSDRRPDGTIYDIYSSTTRYQVGGSMQGKSGSGEGSGYNREHTFPKSWFGGENAKPMANDAFHVMPSDSYINSRRGNDPFGETKGENYTSANGYSKLGKCTLPGYTGIVFEPNDEYKGDLARVYFYMATCYESQIASWKRQFGSPVLASDAYRPYVQWHMEMLLRWAKNDPVSARERERNEAVYKAQGNRNPFVDYPGLEDYVWGDSVNVAFSYDNYRRGVVDVTPTPNPDPTPQPAVDGVVFEESFASGTGSFTVDNKSLLSGMTYVWTRYAKGAVQCVKASAYVKKTNMAAESWLVSPVIDLSNYTAATLSLEQVTAYLNGNDANTFLSIRVRADGGAWEKLGMDVPTVNGGWDFVAANKDMTEYLGKKIEIAFVYTSTEACAPTWEIRNLKLTGTAKTTAIDWVPFARPALDIHAPMYNLSGQRVNHNYKGVIIQNGQKFMNR